MGFGFELCQLSQMSVEDATGLPSRSAGAKDGLRMASKHAASQSGEPVPVVMLSRVSVPSADTTARVAHTGAGSGAFPTASR